MLVDDAWATLGSCNLHANSLFGPHRDERVVLGPDVVRALRCDTAALDDCAALRLYRQVAQENRRRRDAGDFAWQGLAFSLDPAPCGE